MATVNVTWTTQDEVIDAAAEYTQYLVSLDGMTAIEPLGSTMHSFLSVAPGTYAVSVVLQKPDGTQAAPPISTTIVVPEAPTAPVPVTITAAL